MLSIGSLRGTSAIGGAESPPPATPPSAPVFQECGYVDVDQVARIAQTLLVSLGTACVEKTTGDLFNNRGGVVVDVKKEMLDYLQVQSDAYATGSSAVVLQVSGEIPSPLQVVEDILNSFVRSKKNTFSRVSSMILMYNSDRKDDRIEDFVQELEKSGAWMVGRREAVAKALLKRVDRCKMFHCEMKFDSTELLAEHKGKCVLRPVTCENLGCGAVYSALLARPHDATCSFKTLPCEQGCKAKVSRGDMDKHCVTLCPMKSMNCPFSQVGCSYTFPQGLAEQHCVGFVGQHLLLVLRSSQKQEIAVGNQGQRIQLLEKAVSISQRTEAVDVGTILLTVHEQELKMKILEQEVKKLRQELKTLDISAEVLQLRRELRDVQKHVNNTNSFSLSRSISGPRS